MTQVTLKEKTQERLLALAWGTSIVATLGSLNYSGIRAIGFMGMGFFPCELCWYQRILMYPLVLILGMAFVRRERTLEAPAFWFSVMGIIIAGYHSFIQYLPRFEINECGTGCTTVWYELFGFLTIPNQSLIAFLVIFITLGLRRGTFQRLLARLRRGADSTE